MKIRIYSILLILLFTVSVANAQGTGKNIVYLTWEDVIGKTLDNNLGLKSINKQYESQNYEYWKGVASFLPSISYQGSYTNNIEIPVIVAEINGQTLEFKMGQKHNMNHNLSLNLPLFTGGARLLNLGLQSDIKKSLKAEIKGEEESTVYDALNSYFSIILANSVVEVNNEAMEVAKANLDQVQKFYNAGNATELDLQRAKAQYTATLPALETARNNRLLAYQRLKFLLDIPLSDSLVIHDKLKQFDFLKGYSGKHMAELKDIASHNRSDLEMTEYAKDIAKQQTLMAYSAYLPNIIASGTIQQQAQAEDWNDLTYFRGKSVSVTAQWNIFDGGTKALDIQKAKIAEDIADINKQMAYKSGMLDVEQNYYVFGQAKKNIESLEDALEQAKESQRLANLLYKEGMSDQVEVLNAQLLYTQSNLQYLQGVYNYNVSQLALLRSIGKLDSIWK